VPVTVRGYLADVVGRAAAPGLRPDRRARALAAGIGRLFVRRRHQLGWLTALAIWLLR